MRTLSSPRLTLTSSRNTSVIPGMWANPTSTPAKASPSLKMCIRDSDIAVQSKNVFVEDIDRDSEAYDSVFACFKRPKASDEEKAARSIAIQEATKFAALIPCLLYTSK